ncbi:MAG: mechanosensitive ion channel domain-containing protein, partial [Pseudomonadota bacterium]
SEQTEPALSTGTDANAAPRRNRLDWPSAWQPIEAQTAQTAEGAQSEATADPSTPVGGGGDASRDAPGSATPEPGTSGEATTGKPTAGDAAKNDDAASAKSDAAAGSRNSNVVDVAKSELPENLRQLIAPVEAIEKRLDAISKTVERVKERDEELIKVQPQIEELISAAAAQRVELLPVVSDYTSQIEKLGPTPNGEDVAPESADIADERARLQRLLAAADGAVKKAELLEERGKQLVGRLQDLRQDIFSRDNLVRGPSPFAPQLLSEAGAGLAASVDQLNAITSQWLRAAGRNLALLLALAAATVLVYVLLRAGIYRLFLRQLTLRTEQPSFHEQAVAAGLFSPAVVLPSLAAAGVLYAGLDALGLLYLQTAAVAWAGLRAFVVFQVTRSLARAYLQPERPLWRIAEVNDDAAKRLYRIIQLVTALYAIDMVAQVVFDELFAPLPMRILFTFGISLGFALAFLLFVRTPLPTSQTLTAGLLTGLRPEFVKAAYLVVALLIVVGGSLGWVSFGRFLAEHLILITAALLLTAIVFVAVRGISEYPVPGADPSAVAAGAPAPQGAMSLTPGQMQQFVKVVCFALYGGFALLIPVMLLFAFGQSWVEITTVISRAMFGIEIGGVRISLFQALLAVLVFSAILFVTRLVQRGLSASVLSPERLEAGLANSLRTGIGYVGFIIAGLVGLSYAGLDITNLAIVAGALSVGIGFGLQSIVNNFVSGLILLVERPAKVGDWIKVGDQQGYVRRISVRSTEIETFERASVIIPNSELITGQVINLTHRNAMGRLRIIVGVDYNSDPDQVTEILMAAADACPAIARHPAPFVVFEDFGDNALVFSVRAYVANVNNGLSAQTALRLEMFKRLKHAQIGIPFPQRDLHLRDLDGFKGMIARAAEQRMQQAQDNFARDADASAATSPSKSAART